MCTMPLDRAITVLLNDDGVDEKIKKRLTGRRSVQTSYPVSTSRLCLFILIELKTVCTKLIFYDVFMHFELR